MRTTFIVLLTLGIAFGAQAQTTCLIGNSDAPADLNAAITYSNANPSYLNTVQLVFPLSGEPSEVTDDDTFWYLYGDEVTPNSYYIGWYTLDSSNPNRDLSYDGPAFGLEAYPVMCIPDGASAPDDTPPVASTPTCTPTQWNNGTTCQDLTDCPAGQYVTLAHTATSDRECGDCDNGYYSTTVNSESCSPWSTTCPSGTGATQEANATQNYYCSSCPSATYNNGSYLYCQDWPDCGGNAINYNAGIYQSGSCHCQMGYYDNDGDSSDTTSTCLPLDNCLSGEYDVNAIGDFATGITTDRNCQPCENGYYSTTVNEDSCTEWTTCDAGQYESVTPSAIQNRVCENCDAGFWDHDGNSSTACVAHSTCGDNGEVDSAGTATTDVTCTCDVGYGGVPCEQICPFVEILDGATKDIVGIAIDSSPSRHAKTYDTEADAITKAEYLAGEFGSAFRNGAEVHAICPDESTDDFCVDSSGPLPTDVNAYAATSVVYKDACGEELCAAGTWDHDGNSSTACEAHSTCGDNAVASGGDAYNDVTCTCESGYYDADGDSTGPSSNCTAVSLCPAGQYQTSAPTSTENRVCGVCTSGYTATDNVQTSCTDWSAPCTNGSPQTQSPNATHDRVCTPCPAGTYHDIFGTEECEELTTCVVGQHDVRKTDSTQTGIFADRLCQSCDDLNGYSTTVNADSCTDWTITSCPDGQQHTEGTATSDGVCTPCETGDWATSTCGDSCAAGYGYVDGDCIACTDFTYNAANGTTGPCAEMSCPFGEGVSDPAGLNDANTCVACTGVNDTVTETYSDDESGQCKAMAVCNDNQYISTGGTASSNRVCADFSTPEANQYVSVVGNKGNDDEVGNDVTISNATCTNGQYVSALEQGNHTTVGSVTCTEWTNCVAGEYATFGGSTTSDRTCGDCGDGEYTDTPNAEECTAWTDCGAGEYVTFGGSTTSDRTCGDCGDGEYTDTVNAESCTAWSDCVAGQYVTLDGSTTSDRTCASCEEETYSDSTNAGLCTTVNCAEDFGLNWVDPTSNDGNCEACGIGYYSAGGLSTCNSCDAGYGYVDGVCNECTDFTYNSADGTISPCADMSCPLGEGVSDPAGPNDANTCVECAGAGGEVESYSDDFTGQCKVMTVCQAGYMQIQNGNKTNDRVCAICPRGTYSDTENAAECTVCDAGFYAAVAGSTSCTGCPVGTFLADEGTLASLHDAAEDCGVCGAGTYAAAIGSSSCTDCPVGTFLADEGTLASDHDAAEDCGVCGAGTYADVEGSSSCTNCIAGTYLDDAGTDASLHDDAGDCSICSSGQYSGEGAETCSLCIAGTYLEDAGTSASLHNSVDLCLPCAKGHHASAAGSASCDACQYPFYAATEGQANCDETNCPAGKGIRTAADYDTTEDDDYNCNECSLGHASAGGTNACGLCSVAEEFGNVTGLDVCHVRTVCQPGQKRTVIGDVLSDDECEDCVGDTYTLTTNEATCTALSCAAGKELTDVRDRTQDESGNCEDCGDDRWSSAGDNTCAERTKCVYDEEFGSIPQVHSDYTVNRVCTTVTPCRVEDQLQADDKTDISDYVCSDVTVEGDNFIFGSYAELENFESVDPDSYYESTIFGRVLDALPAGKSLYVDTADSDLFGFLFVAEANEATPLTGRMNEIGSTRVRVQGAGVAASSVLDVATLNALTCADKTIDLSTNGETVKTVLYNNTHYALACDGDTLVTAVTINDDEDSDEYRVYCHNGTEFQYIDSDFTGPGYYYTCAVSGDYKHFIASYVASGSVRTEVSLYGDHLVVTGASATTGGSGDTRALYFNIHVSRTGRHELDEHDGFAEVIVAGNIVVDSNVRAHVTEGANGELLINHMAVYQYINDTDGTTTNGLNGDGTGEWERMDKYGDGFASCIEVGQRVLMADGTHKNVEHIVPGDVLRTPEGRTTVRSTRRGGRHLSGVHDVECNGMRASLTGQHAYHCEGEWRLPSETHRARALEGVTEVIAIETDNYCEDKLVLESGLAVESWDGRGVHEWRSHSYENGRRLRCTLKGSWRDSILKRTDERVAVE